jgi:DNA repair protein SbcD/Mre11
MPFRPLRFLHAANLRLGNPIARTGALREAWGQIAGLASGSSWDRLIDLAIAKDVDFLLLTGNSFDWDQKSVFADACLRRGFQRLEDAGLPVFVAPGELDPAAAWDEIPLLPENVTVFHSASDRPVDLTHGGQVYASIFPVDQSTRIDPPELERLRSRSLRGPQLEIFTVGAFCWNGAYSGQLRTERKYLSLHYLGHGFRDRELTERYLPLTEGRIACGTAPQGLDPRLQVASPTQSPDGFGTLVAVDAGGRMSVESIPLASVRWASYDVSLTGLASVDSLIEQMLARLERDPRLGPEALRIVDWKFVGVGRVAVNVDTVEECRALSETLQEWTEQLDLPACQHRVHPYRGEYYAGGDQSDSLGEHYQTRMTEITRAEGSESEGLIASRAPEVKAVSPFWVDRFQAMASEVDRQRVVSEAQYFGRRWFSDVTEEPRA